MIRKSFSEKYASALKESGLEDFPREQLCLLLYDKKEYVFHEGCPVTHLHLILSGRAKVLSLTAEGRILLHSFSEKGGLLGEVEMLTGTENAALHVQAVTPLVCVGIPIPGAAPLLKKNLNFMNHLSLALVTKLNFTSYNSSRIILYSLENRLCSYIEMTSPGGCFEEQLTQVSEFLGTSYRHLLRTIEKLCAEKVLRKDGRHYTILDFQALHSRGKCFYSSSPGCGILDSR